MLFTDGSLVSRTDGAACAAETFQAEGRKLDLLVLMDGSGSMLDPVNGARKWDLVVSALNTFVTDPDSAGIGIALTYFGFPAGFDDAGDLVVSCNTSDYETPAVSVGDLPPNAQPFIASLAAYKPEGGTPTRPALEGAQNYAAAWLARHLTHRVAVVLATDGEPNDCDSTVDAVAEVAEAAAQQTTPILTYVIGVGASLTSLDQVATAGGTGHAYIIDTTQDTTNRFIEAMNAIRSRALLPCEYAIPRAADGGEVDTEKVNVTFTASGDGGGGAKTLILQVPSADDCDPSDGGWYYDDPVAPTTIKLCKASCDQAKADLGGRIDVLVGCKTATAIPR
jgi:hypothetical protein